MYTPATPMPARTPRPKPKVKPSPHMVTRPTIRGKMYAPAAFSEHINVIFRHRPISRKMSTNIIIEPRAIMVSFCVNIRSVNGLKSQLSVASPTVIGIDTSRVLNTLLYAISSFPAPTRWPCPFRLQMKEGTSDTLCTKDFRLPKEVRFLSSSKEGQTGTALCSELKSFRF